MHSTMVETQYHNLRYRHQADGPGKFRPKVKVGNNTYSHMDRDDILGTITITLHGHTIVALFPNGKVAINMCGWDTVTTRDRINQFLPAGVSLSQRNGNRGGWGGDQYLSRHNGGKDYDTKVIDIHSWILLDENPGLLPSRDELAEAGYVQEVV